MHQSRRGNLNNIQNGIARIVFDLDILLDEEPISNLTSDFILFLPYCGQWALGGSCGLFAVASGLWAGVQDAMAEVGKFVMVILLMR